MTETIEAPSAAAKPKCQFCGSFAIFTWLNRGEFCADCRQRWDLMTFGTPSPTKANH